MIEIKNKTECCGCTACVNICPKSCIHMLSDEEGFLYPHVEQDSCIKCGLCNKVCPIQHNEEEHVNLNQKAVILQHKNDEVCKQSTAGGAFTAIAEYVLENDGVVFGATMKDDFTVSHTYVEKKEDLIQYRNSKYVQSNLGDTFKMTKAFLDKGRLVCYSGTPCQIEGLRHYLRKPYQNLILVDVVCRAVPSPGIWKKYVANFIEKNGKLKSVRFRDKTLGYQYSTMEMINSNGKVNRGGIESQQWLRMFFSGMIIRPSCTNCQFRKQYRNSDFTIWDCFNVRDLDKTFDENRGTTRMLIHSTKGLEIFEKIKENVLFKEIPVEIAVKGVKEMYESPKAHLKKEEFYQDVNTLTFDKVLEKYFPNTIKVKIKKNIRSILNFFGLDRLLKRILRMLKKK